SFSPLSLHDALPIFFHTFVTRKVVPGNAAGSTAETHFVHEPRFGQEIKRTDANGCEWTQSVDGLGRVTEAQGPGPDGRLVPLKRSEEHTSELQSRSE